jgi:plasmid stability protein
MAHLVLQDVDPRVIETLSARAARQGRSVEEEARAVLEGALGFSRRRALEAARQLRAQWAGSALTASDELMARDGDRLSEASGGRGRGAGPGSHGDPDGGQGGPGGGPDGEKERS